LLQIIGELEKYVTWTRSHWR